MTPHRFEHTDGKLECPVCHLFFSRIDTLHLKSHNLTKEEYKEQYPDAPYGNYRVVINGSMKENYFRDRIPTYDTTKFSSGYEERGNIRKLENIQREIGQFAEQGFTASDPQYNKFNVRLYTLKAVVCGHIFQTRLSKNIKCPVCKEIEVQETITTRKILRKEKEEKLILSKIIPHCSTCDMERQKAYAHGQCLPCKAESNRQATNNKYFEQLTALGFIVHTDKNLLHKKLEKYDVTNTSCGHRFSAQGGNLLMGLSKCGVCGPINRMRGAMAAYILRYGRTDLDITKEDDYYFRVWQITNKNWDDTTKRSKDGLHLDHIISISWGFRNSIPPELIGDPDNLRLLDGKTNIAKGGRIQDFDILAKLLAKHELGTIELIGESVLMRKCFELIFNRVNSIPNSMNFDIGEIDYGPIIVKVVDINKAYKLEKKPNTIILFSDEVEYCSNSDRQLRIAVSRINNALGNVQKLRASKMTIREITPLENSRFLQVCHFQGKGAGARVKLGLFLDDKIMSVMTFSPPRFSKGYEWELVRFASKIDHRIYGAASKLFNHFVKNYNPKSIISYSDRRWGDGKVYEALNFTKVSLNPKPNYWWSKGNLRRSRYETRLNDLPQLLGPTFDKSKSEKENMLNHGWIHVEDLGSDVFGWAANDVIIP